MGQDLDAQYIRRQAVDDREGEALENILAQIDVDRDSNLWMRQQNVERPSNIRAKRWPRPET